MTSDSEQPTPLLSILSDQPDEEDRLDFGPYAKTLADIIADPGTRTPLTIGIFGGWGQGKTSLMRMIQKRLKATANSDFRVRSVWFNAWLYSQQEALWRALVSQVLKETRKFSSLSDEAQATLHQLESRLYGVTSSPGGSLTLPAGALIGLEGAALPPLMGLELLRRRAERTGDIHRVAQTRELMEDVEDSETLTRRDQISALDDFRRQFERISRTGIIKHGRLAVFVDDLDRCLPDRAVEVLEAIKLFLDVPACIFVLGVARDIIERGIRIRYSDYELDGAKYLEKIIQIPFSLPPIAPDAVRKYVSQLATAGLPDDCCEKVFTEGLEPNPRRIKRTLNIFLLLWRLAQNRPDLRGAIKPVRLAKIVIIQQYHPRLFRLITDGPHYLSDLEKRFREQEARTSDLQEETPLSPEGERQPGGKGDEGVTAGPLADFLGHSLLRALLTCTGPDEPNANFVDLAPDQVLEYIYLTRSTVEEVVAKEEEKEEQIPTFEQQMVTIPAGPFLMGTLEREVDELVGLGADRRRIRHEVGQHPVSLEIYAIGRYPVTNAEFKRFVDDGGYENPNYWTEAGRRQKERRGWKKPRFWDDEQWNTPSQPVVGVSWHEAVAYCNWLSAKTGKPHRLPTEAEWEKAASWELPTSPTQAEGTEGGRKRRYPWGNEWPQDRAPCNNKESRLDHTTPVGKYSPDGDSAYGVGDMVGQVWEWCSSKYLAYPYLADENREGLEGDDTRILRGGSWYEDSPAAVCRCNARGMAIPDDWANSWGFRCATTLS